MNLIIGFFEFLNLILPRVLKICLDFIEFFKKDFVVKNDVGIKMYNRFIDRQEIHKGRKKGSKKNTVSILFMRVIIKIHSHLVGLDHSDRSNSEPKGVAG